jgi:orotidine-5'-phosphate decarboxylase
MTRQELINQIRKKKTFLSVGLDTDIKKIPKHLLSSNDPVFEFNKQIIDATKEFCVCYKINTAFYEAHGFKGWEAMEKTVNYIPSTHFKIADAKRGDIGNTSSQYAKAFFETLNFDAITVAPYMGSDSVLPFLEYKNKWTILLGLTSNPGSKDFELQKIGDEYLYEKVLQTALNWGSPENMMFVVGATQIDWLQKIRQITPDHFYLVPGIGTQGGSLEQICQKAMNNDVGLLLNVSRDIIFSSNGLDFGSSAGIKASQYQAELAKFLQ